MNEDVVGHPSEWLSQGRKSKGKLIEVSPLQWFLDFINTDLKTLSLSEKFKIAAEVKLALDGDIDWLPYSDYMRTREKWHPKDPSGSLLSLYDPDLAVVIELQDHLRRFFEEMFMRIEGTRIYQEKLILKEPSQGGINEIAKLNTNITVRARIILPGVQDFSEDKEAHIALHLGAKLGSNVIRVQFSPDNNKDALIFHFLRAIDDLPLTAIRQCPECKKWFAHLSRREKEFCSNKCAAKKTSRQRYQRVKESDPEAHESVLVNSRKRASNSYHRKMEKKTGSPEVLVGKETRKRTKKES